MSRLTGGAFRLLLVVISEIFDHALLYCLLIHPAVLTRYMFARSRIRLCIEVIQRKYRRQAVALRGWVIIKIGLLCLPNSSKCMTLAMIAPLQAIDASTLNYVTWGVSWVFHSLLAFGDECDDHAETCQAC